MPVPLLALLAATAVLGCCWALLTPPFQAPDENAHVAYVQSLVERGELPGEAPNEFRSTEQAVASDAANSDQLAQQLHARPEWSERRHEEWLRADERLGSEARRDGGGPNPAGPNPPLYYLWESLPYRATAGEDFFSRVTAMRIASVPFLLLTVAATWLLAGVVFGPRRPLQLCAAAVPALLPMVTFISTSVSPDALLYALSTLALWLAARVIVRRAQWLDVACLLAVAGLAVVTKATSYAFLPAVVVAVAIGAYRAGGARRTAAALAVGVAAFALTAGPWYVAARLEERPATGQIQGTAGKVDQREFVSYLWQYYLPRLPFQTPYAPLYAELPQAYETWFKQSIGAFGWLETRWPPPVYAAIALIGLLLAGAALANIVGKRRSIDRGLLAFFAIALLVLVAALHWNEYRLAEGSGVLVSQGRYLFPLIGLFALVPAAALDSLPRRFHGPALGAVLGGLLTLQLFAIGLMATRFFA
jgi:4-amino-4-deoxy-L-arabinose transferase-like glycosyltransferase